MEALHRGGGLEAQKENLNASFAVGSRGGLGKASVTPRSKRAAFSVHSDGEIGGKGVKESAKKNRRALGDISNRHVNRHENVGESKGEGGVIAKKSPGLGKARAQVKPPSGKQRTREATAGKSALLVIGTSLSQVEEVEEAYGGLSSPLPDAQRTKSIREDIACEIRSDKTPTFVDDLNSPGPLADWDSEEERKMLESGAAPSSWWAPPSPLRPEEAEVDVSAYGDVPPPDDFALSPLESLDDHDALDLVLGADLDASTSE